jgi:hypothetical protein
LTDREWNDQDIGKDDCRIELGKALQRLERDLGRRVRIIDEVDKTALLLPKLAIFGQIPAGLAHHPHRHRVTTLAAEHR